MIAIFENTKQTTHGNTKCDYCPKTWKRFDSEFIERHLQEKHQDEIAQAAADKKAAEQERVIIRLQEEKAELQRKLTLANKPAEKKTEYYQAVIYCENENRVFKAGMPKGQRAQDTPCNNCGMKTLKVTSNDPWGIL